MAAGKDSLGSFPSLNSDLDHSKVENCFHEFYTEVNDMWKWTRNKHDSGRYNVTLLTSCSYFII